MNMSNMLREPKLTNTSPDFGKPPEKQNRVNMYFFNTKLYKNTRVQHTADTINDFINFNLNTLFFLVENHINTLNNVEKLTRFSIIFY